MSDVVKATKRALAQFFDTHAMVNSVIHFRRKILAFSSAQRSRNATAKQCESERKRGAHATHNRFIQAPIGFMPAASWCSERVPCFGFVDVCKRIQGEAVRRMKMVWRREPECIAQRLLDALGVRVVQADVGGECGRQMLIDCQHHTFVAKKIARPL